jgi:hypothetical protein
MARTTIGEAVSRIRNQIKAVKQDAFLTDRFLYSMLIKHAKWLMKREDGKMKLLSFASVIQSIDDVELIEVDKVEACCTGLQAGCTIKRTKHKLPVFMQGYIGPLIRSITSVDGSQELQPTLPSSYLNISKSTTFKYNKAKYYWYLNDYLYFPNLDWDAVRVEGIFEDDICSFTCIDDCCTPRAFQLFNVPDYLHGEVEAATLKDLIMMFQLPSDAIGDKQSHTR